MTPQPTGGPVTGLGFSVVDDPATHRVVLFGGVDSDNKTWLWDGRRWTSTTPPWILCSIPCCTGNWVKSVWTSADGGLRWTERSGTDPRQVGSIPFYGSAEALTVTTAGVGIFGASGGAGIYRSSDAGSTWRPTFVDDCINGGNAVYETWFATALVGWAIAGGSVDPRCPTFVHTVNGGVTWSALPPPF